MALYYLDPTREPRECPDCEGTGCDADPTGAAVYQRGCHRCHGTGRLGEEGAEPDVEVIPIPDPHRPNTKVHYVARSRVDPGHDGLGRVLGTGFSRPAALAAARKAHREAA